MGTAYAQCTFVSAGPGSSKLAQTLARKMPPDSGRGVDEMPLAARSLEFIKWLRSILL